MLFWDNDRVTRVTYTSYAVRVQTGRLLLIMAQFACGSVVLVYLFQENLALRAKFS